MNNMQPLCSRMNNMQPLCKGPIVLTMSLLTTVTPAALRRAGTLVGRRHVS